MSKVPAVRSTSEPCRGWVKLSALLALFTCGLAVWIFKIKSSGSDEAGLLPVSPSQALIPFLGVVSVMLMTSRGRIPIVIERGFASVCLVSGIGLIVLGAALHLTSGQGGKDALFFILRWFMPILFCYFFAWTQRRGVSWRPILYGIVVGAVVSLIAVELAKMGLPVPVRRQTDGRYGGFLNHPNQYGIVLSTASVTIVFFLHSSRRWEKLLGLLTITIFGFCLFQSLSKTNIILFLVSLTVGSLVIVARNPLHILRAMVALCLLAGVMVATVSVGKEALWQLSPKDARLIEDALFDPGEVRSIDTRKDSWADAMTYIRKHPVMGLGPGVADDVLLNNHAHNLFLQMYLDAGLSGVTGIALVVVGILWRGLQLIGQAARRRQVLDDERVMRTVSGIAIIIYVVANTMSDSFGTATMPVFVTFAAFAFVSVPKNRRRETGIT
jgi:O-antigen ligase